jgi:hypothetical protein
MKLTRTIGGHTFEMDIGRDPRDPAPRPDARREDLIHCLVVSFAIDGTPVRREDFDLALRLQSIAGTLA